MLLDLSKILPHPESTNTEVPRTRRNPLAILMTLLPVTVFPSYTHWGRSYTLENSDTSRLWILSSPQSWWNALFIKKIFSWVFGPFIICLSPHSSSQGMNTEISSKNNWIYYNITEIIMSSTQAEFLITSTKLTNLHC